MPWKGVTVSEQRQQFLEDYQSNYYSITDLAERFGISRRTAHTHPGHLGAIENVVFSDEATFIAAASADGTVRLWGIPR